MRPDLFALTHEAERLQEVHTYADEDLPEAIGAIVLQFEATTLILIANGDDDTIVWGSVDDL